MEVSDVLKNGSVGRGMREGVRGVRRRRNDRRGFDHLLMYACEFQWLFWLMCRSMGEKLRITIESPPVIRSSNMAFPPNL